MCLVGRTVQCNTAFFSPPFSVLWPTFQDCIHLESVRNTETLQMNCRESPHTSKLRCHWTEHIVIVYAIQKKKKALIKNLPCWMWKYLNIWACLFPPPSDSLPLSLLLSLSRSPSLCVSVCGKIAAIFIWAACATLNFCIHNEKPKIVLKTIHKAMKRKSAQLDIKRYKHINTTSFPNLFISFTWIVQVQKKTKQGKSVCLSVTDFRPAMLNLLQPHP